MRDADERRNASIITHSSMMLRSTSAHVGCTMKTSVPRMFSSIWNETLGIWKPLQPGVPHRNAEEVRDLLRERRMGAACKQFQLAAIHRPKSG